MMIHPSMSTELGQAHRRDLLQHGASTRLAWQARSRRKSSAATMARTSPRAWRRLMFLAAPSR